LSPSIDFEKDARSVVWASSKCGSPPLRAASTWSTALPPSSHAVRASDRSERPRSRIDATSSGSRRCLLRSLLRKTREASFWESSKCGSPPLWIGRGGAAAWEDGGRAVLQVRWFACGNPPLWIGRGGAAAWEDGGRAVLQVRWFACGNPPRRMVRVWHRRMGGVGLAAKSTSTGTRPVGPLLQAQGNALGQRQQTCRGPVGAVHRSRRQRRHPHRCRTEDRAAAFSARPR
jgi:hypothetical protein